MKERFEAALAGGAGIGRPDHGLDNPTLLTIEDDLHLDVCASGTRRRRHTCQRFGPAALEHNLHVLNLLLA